MLFVRSTSHESRLLFLGVVVYHLRVGCVVRTQYFTREPTFVVGFFFGCEIITDIRMLRQQQLTEQKRYSRSVYEGFGR